MRKPKLKAGQFVEVEWADITSDSSSWQSPEEAEIEPLTCHTAGYVVKSDKTKLVVTPTMAEHGKVANVWAIPAGAIKRVKVIKSFRKG